MADDKIIARQLFGKTVVSKTGKKFGEVGDLIFETKTGEIIHIVVKQPTVYAAKMELEKDKDGSVLIPFSAVIAIGDYLVVSEEDIV